MLNAGKQARRRMKQRGSGPMSTKPQTNFSDFNSTNFWLLLTSLEAMNIIIQAQLDRVETALNALIESIASYNPSVPTANALLAADDDLNKGLKQRMNKPSRSHKTLLQDSIYASYHLTVQ